MTGWLIAVGILTLLAILPLGVSIRFDESGATGNLIAGPVGITLFPRKKKKKMPAENGKDNKQSKEDKTRKPKPKPSGQPDTAKPEGEQKHGGAITDFLPLVRIGLNFLGDFRRKLRVDVLELKLILAGDDPCDLALNYGRAWEAIGNLQPRLERYLVIKKRDISVECDFTETKTRVKARLDLTITLGRVVALAVVYGVRALRAFLHIRNQRKGGAVNEQKSS